MGYSKKAKESAGGETSGSISPKLNIVFEKLFEKLFDDHERNYWLSQMNPRFDDDMETVIFTAQSMWAYDWTLKNFASRLDRCCGWILEKPNGKRVSREKLPYSQAREKIITAIKSLDQIEVEQSKSNNSTDKRNHGVQQLNFAECVPALRSLGNVMLARLEHDQQRQSELKETN